MQLLSKTEQQEITKAFQKKAYHSIVKLTVLSRLVFELKPHTHPQSKFLFIVRVPVQ